MNPSAYQATLIAVLVALAATLIPVLLSKRAYLRQRWFSWLAIFAVFTGAITLDGVSIQIGWPTHVITGLLWIAVAFKMQGEILNLASNHENRSAFFLILFTILNFTACLSLWLQGWQGYVLLFLLAAFDVAAWVGGQLARRFGWHWATRQISPKTSPNKTLGGLLAGSVATWGMLLLVGFPSLPLWVAIVILGPLGDWLESAFKRKIGVKDAADWLPGFGGLLDRLDSLLFLAPVALLLQLMA